MLYLFLKSPLNQAVYKLYFCYMARKKDSFELKAVKQDCTRQFVSAIESQNPEMLPRDFEKSLGLGREVKNGLTWNSYRRGDRAIPIKRISKLIELAVHQGLLSQEIGQKMQESQRRKIAFALLSEQTSSTEDVGQSLFEETIRRLTFSVEEALAASRWLEKNGSGYVESGDQEFVENEILRRLAPVFEYAEAVKIAQRNRKILADSFIQKSDSTKYS